MWETSKPLARSHLYIYTWLYLQWTIVAIATQSTHRFIRFVCLALPISEHERAMILLKAPMETGNSNLVKSTSIDRCENIFIIYKNKQSFSMRLVSHCWQKSIPYAQIMSNLIDLILRKSTIFFQSRALFIHSTVLSGVAWKLQWKNMKKTLWA